MFKGIQILHCWFILYLVVVNDFKGNGRENQWLLLSEGGGVVIDWVSKVTGPKKILESDPRQVGKRLFGGVPIDSHVRQVQLCKLHCNNQGCFFTGIRLKTFVAHKLDILKVFLYFRYQKRNLFFRCFQNAIKLGCYAFEGKKDEHWNPTTISYNRGWESRIDILKFEKPSEIENFPPPIGLFSPLVVNLQPHAGVPTPPVCN